MLGRVTRKAVQKDGRHFLRSMGRWRHLSLWGLGGTEPLVLSTPCCPGSVALTIGCLGMSPGPGCPAVGVSGRWLLHVFSWDFQLSLAGFSGIRRRSCRKVTWTPAPLCFLPPLLFFLFCFRSGCLSALHPSVGTGYASSRDLGFPRSTWMLDLLSPPVRFPWHDSLACVPRLPSLWVTHPCSALHRFVHTEMPHPLPPV